MGDILIAVTDGLKGIGEALEAVFPQAALQTCIVHLLRNSLSFAGWKECKLLAAALRPIYTAVSAEAALAELDAFERGPWGQKFPRYCQLVETGPRRGRRRCASQRHMAVTPNARASLARSQATKAWTRADLLAAASRL